MLRLVTPRLILRDHVPEDLASHHALLSSAVVLRYRPVELSRCLSESETNLHNAIEQIAAAKRRDYFLRIEEAATGAHVGEIGYNVETFAPIGKVAGLGYFIWDRYWGQGYTTEAARELIRFGFEEGGVYRFSSGCLKENAASERVMQKCGMIKEAERIHCQLHEGVLKDRVEYRILKSEWECART